METKNACLSGGSSTGEGDPREGAHLTTRIDTNIDRLRKLITYDQRLRSRALSAELIITKTLHNDFNMRNMCVKMMREVLTHEETL